MLKKLIILAIGVIVMLITYNLVNQIADALKSGERLNREAENVYKLEIRNKELKKKLAEVYSPIFIEEQARNKLGLGKKGETIIVIPEDKIRQVLGSSQSTQEARLPNWLGWWKVFFK